MRYEFKLPDLAEGMVEGELVGWLVAAGDAVKQEQPVAEVMTDKATVVIPSPVAGTVLDLPWQAGDIVKVGQVLVVFEAAGEIPTQRTHAGHVAPGEAPAVPVASAASAAVASAAPAAPSVAVTSSPSHAAVAAVAAVAAPTAERRAEVASAVQGHAEVPRGSRALAAPATRRLARELGVDIGEVAGSGPGGRVTPEDLQRHVAPAPAPTVSARDGRGAAPAASARVEETKKAPSWTPSARTSPAGESEERQKLRGLRRAIYDTMSRSKRTAAHFTYVDEVDCENLVAAHAVLAKAVEPKGVRLTYLAFIAKACLLAIPRFPKINASLDDDKQEVVLKKHVHLGIAAATDAGLLVPTLRHADRMSLLDLAWHIQDLGDRAKQNRLKPEELKGSTFTITSLGKLGGLFATPIINHPESAIVGVHQMQKRAVVIETKDGDQIVARRRMNLSLSFDHRLIDGHEGAAFAQAVKAYLEQPELMLLETV